MYFAVHGCITVPPENLASPARDKCTQARVERPGRETRERDQGERPGGETRTRGENTEGVNRFNRTMWWWWWEQDYRGPQRTPSEVVCDTLMLELSWQSREAERAHRERQSEGQRLRTGVDYSWLQSSPCRSHSLSTGERLGLEELCAQVPPSHCGHTVLRFREAMQVHEPEPQEVSSVFRTVLLQTLEGVREQQEAQRLERQWNTQRRSVSLLNFRTRLRVNPFSSAQDQQQGAQLSLKTVSQDVERGVQDQQQDQQQDQLQDQGRVWSIADFRHQRGKVL